MKFLPRMERYRSNFSVKKAKKVIIPPVRHFCRADLYGPPVLTRRSSRVLAGRRMPLIRKRRRPPPARMPFGPWSFLTNCLETREWFIIHHTDCGMGVVHEMKPCPNCSRRAWRRARLEEVKEATQVGAAIGLVEIPFVEGRKAEVCQAGTFSASSSQVGAGYPAPIVVDISPVNSLM